MLQIGAALLLAGFIAVERRIASPMLDLSLFRRPDFVGATNAALASGAGVLSIMSIMSLIPIILHRAMDVDTVPGAIVLLAWSATTAVSAVAARWIPATPRNLMIGGLVAYAAGQLAVCGLHSNSPIIRVIPGMLLAGAANGVLNAKLGRQAVASILPDRMFRLCVNVLVGIFSDAGGIGKSLNSVAVAALQPHQANHPGAQRQ